MSFMITTNNYIQELFQSDEIKVLTGKWFFHECFLSLLHCNILINIHKISHRKRVGSIYVKSDGFLFLLKWAAMQLCYGNEVYRFVEAWKILFLWHLYDHFSQSCWDLFFFFFVCDAGVLGYDMRKCTLWTCLSR